MDGPSGLAVLRVSRGQLRMSLLSLLPRATPANVKVSPEYQILPGRPFFWGLAAPSGGHCRDLPTLSHLPGAMGLIFRSSSPKRDRKEKGASAAGGSFSPMVTTSGPRRCVSASSCTSFPEEQRTSPSDPSRYPSTPIPHVPTLCLSSQQLPKARRRTPVSP